MTAGLPLDARRLPRTVGRLLLGLVALYAVLAFLPPIEDADFWWHLATGDAIAAGRRLLHEDPFSFASAGAPRGREEFILTSYWLSQLAYHAVFALGGLKGIVVARALLLAWMFTVAYRRMRRAGVDLIVSASLVAVSIAVFVSLFFGDRPQVFSFLGATLLLGWMERIRDGDRPSLLVVPLMLVWSNLHGGFVMGDLLLAVFAAGAVVQYRADRRRLLVLLAWAAAGIASSFANPNSIGAFRTTVDLARDPVLLAFVDEYMSTAEAFGSGLHVVMLVWGLVALVPLAMVAARRLYWPDVLLWAVTGLLAVRYTRNVGFLVPALVPVFGHYLQLALRSGRLAHRAFAVELLAALGACALMVTTTASLLGRGAPMRRDVGESFPVAASEFLVRHGVSGRIMNEYDWGGYLLWRLRPASQVFIDGRILAPDRVMDYARMLWGAVDEQRGAHVYRELLDANGIEIVVLRPYMLLGNLVPLTLRLLEDPDWVPTYVDRQAVVLLRRTALARSAPGTALTLEEFIVRWLRVLESISAQAPDDYRLYLARAELYEWLGRPGEARSLNARALQLAPENPFALGLASRVGR